LNELLKCGVTRQPSGDAACLAASLRTIYISSRRSAFPGVTDRLQRNPHASPAEHGRSSLNFYEGARVGAFLQTPLLFKPHNPCSFRPILIVLRTPAPRFPNPPRIVKSETGTPFHLPRTERTFPKMATAPQLTANRANSLASTGPRTEEAKRNPPQKRRHLRPLHQPGFRSSRRTSRIHATPQQLHNELNPQGALEDTFVAAIVGAACDCAAALSRAGMSENSRLILWRLETPKWRPHPTLRRPARAQAFNILRRSTTDYPPPPDRPRD